EETPEREVRIARRVARLQLGVRRRLLDAAEDGGDADRRLPVVVAPTGERARPVVRDDAVVRVEAGRRQAAEPAEVLEDAGDERPRVGGETVGGRPVVEAVAISLPQREVDVSAVAGIRRPRLRRERRDEAVARGDGADRLADEDLLVGCLERRRVRRRDLLLAVPALRVGLLEGDGLRGGRGRELLRVVLCRGRRDRREAERRVDRHVLVLDARRERELVLERAAGDETTLGETCLHPLEERALADGRGLAVEPDVV